MEWRRLVGAVCVASLAPAEILAPRVVKVGFAMTF